MASGYEFDRPITLSCPECAGTLRCERQGDLLLYRCHIGHRLTGQAMLQAQMAQLEQRLCSCLSLLNERAELCRQLSEAALPEGQDAEPCDAARRETLERALPAVPAGSALAAARDCRLVGLAIPQDLGRTKQSFRIATVGHLNS